jgi:hypothetical protein
MDMKVFIQHAGQTMWWTGEGFHPEKDRALDMEEAEALKVADAYDAEIPLTYEQFCRAFRSQAEGEFGGPIMKAVADVLEGKGEVHYALAEGPQDLVVQERPGSIPADAARNSLNELVQHFHTREEAEAKLADLERTARALLDMAAREDYAEKCHYCRTGEGASCGCV